LVLADWLAYQERVHPRSIALGLERVSAVWRRLGAPPPAPVTITVGGTNGKGSTVAFLDAMLAAAGKRVGCYTSPHLLRYNERVRVLGADVHDEALVAAFECIEDARTAEAIPLTYFEYGTLAALWIFAQSKLDVAVLEVGLGGRLDAVNIVDADAAIVTTIGLDHQDWLGNDVDAIGREKAGIFRAGRPAVIGTREPPAGLVAEAARIGARIVQAGRDYATAPTGTGWRWSDGAAAVDLPDPALAAPCQRDNAAAAIAALYTLRDRLGWAPEALAAGVQRAHVAARLQRFVKAGAADLVVDVGHNPQAAGVLAQWLETRPSAGRTLAVFGALADKDVGGIAAPFRDIVTAWFLAGLDAETPRGLDAGALAQRTAMTLPRASLATYAAPEAALDAAAAEAESTGRILAFGSFFVAAAALRWAAARGYREAGS